MFTLSHFRFRGNPADREQRLILNRSEQPAAEPTPVEQSVEQAPQSVESADTPAVTEQRDAAVDATQAEAAATPAAETPQPLIVEGTGGKRLGAVIVSRLPGNEEGSDKAVDTTDSAVQGAGETPEPTVRTLKASPRPAAAPGAQTETDGPAVRTLEASPPPAAEAGEAATEAAAVEAEAAGEELADTQEGTTEKAAEAASSDPELDRLSAEVDQGIQDLEKAKTPAESLAALGKIITALIEMVKRTLGVETETEAKGDRVDDSRGTETDADTSTEGGLRTELKERGAKSTEEMREELADLREQAESNLEETNEEISKVDAEVDELQTEKDTVDDQIQTVRKQLIDIEQGQSDGDADKLRSELQKLERKSERIQKKIDKAMDRRREWVQLKKKIETTISLIDKLEKKLDSLENTFDRIEQALQKKFDVTVKIERDEGKTIFNITRLGEGTPVWFKEFVEEHDQDGNVNNGYQLDISKAEQLSKMPESKPQQEKPAEDAAEEDAEDSAETPTKDAGEEKEDTPAPQESTEQERTPENITADIASQKEAVRQTLDSSGADKGKTEIDASLTKIGELVQELSATDDVLVGPALEDITGDSFMSEADGNTYRIALEGGVFVLQKETTDEAPADTQPSQPETETPAPASADVADTAEPGNTETYEEVTPEDAQAIEATVNRLDAIKGMIDMGDITNIDQQFAEVNRELADITAEKPYTSSYMESAVASKLAALDLGGTVSYENGELRMATVEAKAETEEQAPADSPIDEPQSPEQTTPTPESSPELARLQEWAKSIEQRAKELGIDIKVSTRPDGWMEFTAQNDAAKEKFEAIKTAADGRGIEHDMVGEGVMAVRVVSKVEGKGYFGDKLLADDIAKFQPEPQGSAFQA